MPLEYWRPEILSAIASGIGTPIALDDATSKRTFRQIVSGERRVYFFFVGVEYEKLPLFYFFCQNIGHSLANCKKNLLKNDDIVKDPPKHAPKEVSRKTAVYVPKKNVNDNITNVMPNKLNDVNGLTNSARLVNSESRYLDFVYGPDIIVDVDPARGPGRLVDNVVNRIVTPITEEAVDNSTRVNEGDVDNAAYDDEESVYTIFDESFNSQEMAINQNNESSQVVLESAHSPEVPLNLAPDSPVPEAAVAANVVVTPDNAAPEVVQKYLRIMG